jgi:hypothetical protein
MPNPRLKEKREPRLPKLKLGGVQVAERPEDPPQKQVARPPSNARSFETPVSDVSRYAKTAATRYVPLQLQEWVLNQVLPSPDTFARPQGWDQSE